MQVRVDILSKEYPPAVYGGAGVHVAELTRALRDRGDTDVRVRCFGDPRDEGGTTGYPDLAELAGANPALTTMGVDLAMAADCGGADLVHSHTWYANFAGHTASLLHGVPHVVSAHSLEPLRPWKAEQLGGGYRLSSWVERTAYEAAAGVIAVSHGMRADILRSYPGIDPARVHVVHNGIDSQLWQRAEDPDVVVMTLDQKKAAEESGFLADMDSAGLKYAFIDFRQDPLEHTAASMSLLGGLLDSLRERHPEMDPAGIEDIVLGCVTPVGDQGADIARTGAKLYKQKGTGRARHGSARAPQFRGGGKAHGPVSRSHAHDLPKKVRALALRHALSAKAKSGGLIVVDDLVSQDGKTKAMLQQFAGLGVTNALVIGGAELNENFARSTRNIPHVDVLPVQGINVYDILRRDTLVLTYRSGAFQGED